MYYKTKNIGEPPVNINHCIEEEAGLAGSVSIPFHYLLQYGKCL